MDEWRGDEEDGQEEGENPNPHGEKKERAREEMLDAGKTNRLLGSQRSRRDNPQNNSARRLNLAVMLTATVGGRN